MTSIESTPIHGSFTIESKVFKDSRGYFFESRNDLDLFKADRSMPILLQTNVSFSKQGTIRGLHIQKDIPQGKLVRCLKGKIYDVCLDLRRSSPTFKRWFGIELSDGNRTALWLPEGTAHGFAAIEDSLIVYECSNVYSPKLDGGVYYADPEIGIEWPFEPKFISDKDRQLPSLMDYLASRI